MEDKDKMIQYFNDLKEKAERELSTLMDAPKNGTACYDLIKADMLVR